MILFLLACASDVVFEGTLVGNAGSGKGKFAENDNIQIVESEITVLSLSVLDVEGIELYKEMIHVDIVQEPMPMPMGEGETLTLQIASRSISYIQNDVFMEYKLPEMNVVFQLNQSLVDAQYLFELGRKNWLEDPEPENLVIQSSSLFLDSNQDGSIDEEERSNPIGIASIVDDHDDDGDHDDEDDHEEDTAIDD